MAWLHTYKCITCMGTVEYRSNNKNSDSPQLVSLFHKELAADKGVTTVINCLGRMQWASTKPVTLPVSPPSPLYRGPSTSYINLPARGKLWVDAMRRGGGGCNVPTAELPENCQNNGVHHTDPRTGKQKNPGVGVYEYYIGGADGGRAVARRGPPATTLELFWSTTHLGNSYNYHLIT